ncbi:MAG: WbqC family protein [Paludibacteraceae bacterium]
MREGSTLNIDGDLNNISNGVILSTAYLPPVSYLGAMLEENEIWLEACENYIKQSYRNRCRIATANGIEILSIPVESNSGKKIQIRDVRISSHGNWQQIHWKALTSAYMNSPFFEYYQDDFLPFYEKKWTFLWDYNLELLTLILHLLDISAQINFTEKYENAPLVFKDLREDIHPKKESLFHVEPYYQVFENKFGFFQDLSIVDLLFNMGNESFFIVRPNFHARKKM